MKTVSFGIASYCVPCSAHCRYCLLSSCGKATGAGYDESTAFADRVIRELDEKRPDLNAFFYIGYCMDTPRLFDYIRFSKDHHSPGARFLQMNGFRSRTDEAFDELMKGVRDNGVEQIDLTFYGDKNYHDRFAGCKGDFDILLRMLDAANRAKLPAIVTVPLFRENLDGMDALSEALKDRKIKQPFYYLPHNKGRGRALQEQRLTKQEFDSLPKKIRAGFSKTPHKTEAQWLASGEVKDPETRNLNLVLTPENLPRYADMPAEEILAELEALDDSCRARMPGVAELAARYGRPDNQQLFRFRDLLLRWQQEYIADNGGTLYDMQDESHHFSVYK
ncbi:MAG: hypothetical protein IK104_00435 [Clostridia bacterium]|nr:hypothetical protein [Clostridia bacterium]